MARLQQEILAKLSAAYVKAVSFDERPALRETCNCNAFAFTHLLYGGDCEGPQQGGARPIQEAA